MYGLQSCDPVGVAIPIETADPDTRVETDGTDHDSRQRTPQSTRERRGVGESVFDERIQDQQIRPKLSARATLTVISTLSAVQTIRHLWELRGIREYLLLAVDRPTRVLSLDPTTRPRIAFRSPAADPLNGGVLQESHPYHGHAVSHVCERCWRCAHTFGHGLAN